MKYNNPAKKGKKVLFRFDGILKHCSFILKSHIVNWADHFTNFLAG